MFKTLKSSMKKLVLMLMTIVLTMSASLQMYVMAVDVGTNPTPKIDIAVNVPSDYPGTFLDYKQELTQKLIDQGLSESDFRITSTAVSIDTTSITAGLCTITTTAMIRIMLVCRKIRGLCSRTAMQARLLWAALPEPISWTISIRLPISLQMALVFSLTDILVFIRARAERPIWLSRDTAPRPMPII